MEEYLVGRIEDDEGIRERYKFSGGYGASVIKNKYSHGGNQGLYEVASIYWESRYTFVLHYSDDFDNFMPSKTINGVKGYLTREEVLKVLEYLKGLD